ncbi:UDP-N-acetylglucosamine 2-epimerase [Streptomyces sp. NPDC093109]|uniref:UDP-N-acetylglucosamine 2-epimerase n=1 Tax=Streptomyces sp. NPDC093109 TaxID=3154977 RepID=UPI00344D7374
MSESAVEAPAFRIPALVTLDRTEHTEGLHAGCARLVGTDTDRIAKEADSTLTNPATVRATPYGDGKAAGRAAQACTHGASDSTHPRRTGAAQTGGTAARNRSRPALPIPRSRPASRDRYARGGGPAVPEEPFGGGRRASR